MTSMTSAVFIGKPEALSHAYPADLRQEMAGSFGFPLGEQTEESVRDVDLRDIEVIFGTWNLPRFDREFLESAPDLRSVFYAAGTVKHFVTPEVYARGITVCGAWRANAVPVAEYTISVILLSLKKFWQTSRPLPGNKIKGHDVFVPGAYRKKVGLVSLGAIGLRVAELLSLFDLDLVAYDPFCDPILAKKAGIRLVALDELFRECDVVSIHTPLLPQTVKLVNVALVRSMKEGATLINTARGGVLDEDPVLKVFRDRTDLTAILDVAITEPPPESSLIHTLDNVVYTPHIAGSRGSEVARMGNWMVEEARRFLAGEPLHHQITFDMLDKVA